MSDNINQMNYKQLRNEVQLLRDELAIMKRKYEDIIYNLDTDNFSQRIVKQGKNMYTKIEQNAEEISLQAEKVGENSKNIASLEITADEIQSEVFVEREDGTKTSRITQMADRITSEVKSLSDADVQLSTRITQNTNSIVSEVVALQAKDTELSTKITQTESAIESEVTAREKADNTLSTKITQTANRIETRVEDLENFKTSVFTQKSEGFYLDGDVTKFTGVLYLTDDSFKDKASIYYGDGSDDMNQEYIAFWPNDYSMPMVLGYNPEKVYISSIANGNQIATRQWVLQNGGGGGTAKFA